MKRAISAFCLTALLAAAPIAVAGEQPAAAAKASAETYTGWIVDEYCGAKNANADGKNCTLDCHKKGAKLVLYVPDTKKTIVLDDQKLAETNVGKQVKVTGTMDGDTLKVSKIEPAKA